MAPKKRSRADDLVATLVQERDKPEPSAAQWRERYTPDAAEQYAAELADLEDQLDLAWAGWRKSAPFHRETPDKIAWIKARLLRRRLILDGKGDHGVATVRKGGDGIPIAVPVRPARVEVPRDAYRPLVTVPLLARRTGLPVQRIQELLPRLPDGVRDVRSWLVGEVARSQISSSHSAAPLPLNSSDSVPLPDNAQGVH
jgi:hypothetical protein